MPAVPADHPAKSLNWLNGTSQSRWNEMCRWLFPAIPGPGFPAGATTKERASHMAEVKTGDTVRVHYEGSLEDGRKFDSSLDREPIELTVGSGQVISGFENAVVGMEEGDSRTVTVPPEEGYGPHDPNLLHKVDREQVPDEIDLQVGAQLQATDRQGQVIALTVADFDDSTVTLDANHPLAGQDLTFDVKVVEIVK